MIPAQHQQPPQGASARPRESDAGVARDGPGAMWLQAVRERGCIVDFRWDFANAPAARLMACHPDALRGQRLTDVLGGPHGHPALIDSYRCVIEHGNAQSFAQVHWVNGRQDIVIHRVVRTGDGVNVTLTNLSADRRAQALRLGIESNSERH
jgi:hypothetical protein